MNFRSKHYKPNKTKHREQNKVQAFWGLSQKINRWKVKELRESEGDKSKSYSPLTEHWEASAIADSKSNAKQIARQGLPIFSH